VNIPETIPAAEDKLSARIDIKVTIIKQKVKVQLNAGATTLKKLFFIVYFLINISQLRARPCNNPNRIKRSVVPCQIPQIKKVMNMARIAPPVLNFLK
jgi:hypothetical protein